MPDPHRPRPCTLNLAQAKRHRNTSRERLSRVCARCITRVGGTLPSPPKRPRREVVSSCLNDLAGVASVGFGAGVGPYRKQPKSRILLGPHLVLHS